MKKELAIAHADSTIFILGQMGAQSVIKGISLSIGSKKLDPLYEDMKKGNSMSFDLINISIHLDHFKEIPEKDIYEILDNGKKYYFTSTLLKMLVIDTLLKYPPSKSKRQSIFARMGVQISPQLLQDFEKARLLESEKSGN
jgi:hypothetical protein